ncbi:MAG: aldehyde dehydrogenase family protein [Planctomycetes bacterium]|nr:aldehyde dehydrogenase family protein [Planctomycetota bacterium]
MTDSTPKRPVVRKTYKLYVGGKFPRTESGRSYAPAGCPTVQVCRGSRKDLRDAVVAARKGLEDWAGRTGYNRGQILYRVAEMLETRKAALAAEIVAASGVDPADAEREVEAATDLCCWWAGVPDKLNALLGSQNDVNGPFFAFSTVEPTGVIGVLAAPETGFFGLLALMLPLLAGGNAVVALVPQDRPLAALAFGEVCASSDVPAGAVNLLSGLRSELAGQFASHRDLDGLLVAGLPEAALGAAAADSVKRIRYAAPALLELQAAATPRRLDWLEPFVECKTLWHPVAW